MNFDPVNNTCFFNTIYIQYTEDIGENEYFSYDLKFPVFYNVKNGYFQVNENILKNLNNTINSSVYDFKNGILEEEKQINASTSDGIKTKVNYRVNSNYDLTFNKNQLISLILNLSAFEQNNPQYNDLYSYNIDLLTGKQISIKDIFRPGVNYTKLISDFINLQISKNPTSFYENMVVDIPDDQSFYLTDKGIVIYFGLDEIAPADKGIPKFLMEFENFSSYINPRFYCNAKNMNYNKNMINRIPKYNRIYY